MQERYTAIPIPCNLFSYAISNEAATPNEPERSLFFSVVIRIAWYRVRRGVSPSPAAGYDAERIYTAYAGLREFGGRKILFPSLVLRTTTIASV